jgi:YVTN family beta-propeller protein
MGRVVRWLAALLLLAVVAGGALWAGGGRSGGPGPATAPHAGGQAATAAARAAELDRHLREHVFRLQITTHPAGATVHLRPAAGGPARSGRTPLLARVRGGHLQLTLARPGSNRLGLPVLLDRDRSPDLWLDPAGLLHHKLGEARTGSNPKQVAFTPDGKELWVTLLGGHGVEVFDVPSLRRKRSIRLGEHGAVEVVFSRDGRTAYASQMETASVWVIDRRTYRVSRHLATGGVWSKVLALSPDQRTLYVANWVSNNVSVIDLGSGRVRRLLPTVRTPRGLWPTPDGRRLYVAGFEDGELERIDLRSGRRKLLLHTGGAMRHLAGDPERGRLYADDMAKSEAFVVDLPSERVRRLAATDSTPNTIDLSPDGRVLYVSNRGRNGPCYCAPDRNGGRCWRSTPPAAGCWTRSWAATRPPAWTSRATAGCWPSPTSSITGSACSRSRPTGCWPPVAAGGPPPTGRSCASGDRSPPSTQIFHRLPTATRVLPVPAAYELLGALRGEAADGEPAVVSALSGRWSGP